MLDLYGKDRGEANRVSLSEHEPAETRVILVGFEGLRRLKFLSQNNCKKSQEIQNSLVSLTVFFILFSAFEHYYSVSCLCVSIKSLV